MGAIHKENKGTLTYNGVGIDSRNGQQELTVGRRIRYGLTIAGGALLFVAGCLFLVLLIPLFMVSALVSKGSSHLARTMMAFCLRVFAGYIRLSGFVRFDPEELRAIGRLPDGVGRVLAPTHPCLLDALLIIAYRPQVGCIMKASLVKNPLISPCAKMAKFIPNSPVIRMIRDSKAAIKAGQTLLIFPEGTRTKPGASLNPFRPAAAAIATATGCPAVPVIIRSDSPYGQKGWPMWKIPAHPMTLKFSICDEIMPEPGESSRDFNQRLEEQFRDLLAPPSETAVMDSRKDRSKRCA